MRIWMATVGEPLPIDEGPTRLLRTAQFAQWAADRGHDVVFFTNTMDHYKRKLRANATTVYEISENYKIIALEGRHYKGSMTMARLMSHMDVAASFRAISSDLTPPDVVLSSYPIEELSRALLDYCEPRGIPVVLDTRDFWPDIFPELLPRALRWAGRLVFFPFEYRARQTFRRATAVSGITRSAMEWGQKMAGRAPRETDFWFPFSYVRLEQRPPIAREGLRLCFLGTLTPRNGLEVVIDAMRILQKSGLNYQLDICGTGEAEGLLRTRAEGLENVRFRGWLNATQLLAVLAESDFGVLPYNRPDFFKVVPNKFAEYLAAGVPVFSCTDGEVRSLIVENECGIWAEPDAAKMADALARTSSASLAILRGKARQTFDNIFEQDRVFADALAHLKQVASNLRR
ncbi:glycosyltransferase family 4 protein [Shinella oryzae]|uniref:Glycosyltransferase family 4 protein n=1 Tax=Shinella oryzae TaxID=2871820 RepID=A0ABY9JYT0_9HYPH|nr:glycosyltransferase family 4 protein [Shinella oryzae]WLS01478.1 glycosyltransferase family 4 protein [Shinella oryzae]